MKFICIKVLFPVLFLIIILFFLISFFRIKNSQFIIDQYLEAELQGGITSRDITKRISNNPFHPKYIYVGNFGGLEEEPDSFRVYYYFTLNRKGINKWEIDIEKSRHGLSYLSIEEVVTLLENNNILENNPNPEKLSIQKLNQFRQRPLEKTYSSYEEEYYDLEKSTSRINLKAEDFEKLRLNMNADEVESVVGEFDEAVTKGVITQKYEQRYKITNSEINFAILVFDAMPVYEPNAKLIDAKFIYKDRTVEDLKLDSK